MTIVAVSEHYNYLVPWLLASFPGGLGMRLHCRWTENWKKGEM